MSMEKKSYLVTHCRHHMCLQRVWGFFGTTGKQTGRLEKELGNRIKNRKYRKGRVASRYPGANVRGLQK